jgi:hypothetical protein
MGVKRVQQFSSYGPIILIISPIQRYDFASFYLTSLSVTPLDIRIWDLEQFLLSTYPLIPLNLATQPANPPSLTVSNQTLPLTADETETRKASGEY